MPSLPIRVDQAVIPTPRFLLLKELVKKNGFRSCDGDSVFSRDLIFKEVSVLFGSLLDQFVSSFDRANGLSIFQFDADRFIDFSAKDFDRWVQWIRDSRFAFNF